MRSSSATAGPSPGSGASRSGASTGRSSTSSRTSPTRNQETSPSTYVYGNLDGQTMSYLGYPEFTVGKARRVYKAASVEIKKQYSDNWSLTFTVHLEPALRELGSRLRGRDGPVLFLVLHRGRARPVHRRPRRSDQPAQRHHERQPRARHEALRHLAVRQERHLGLVRPPAVRPALGGADPGLPTATTTPTPRRPDRGRCRPGSTWTSSWPTSSRSAEGSAARSRPA
ncbi:MAG: hypothetical protein M0C28_03145 [Candidatus Moduliflexus flocculans]|nr:hypothetical protein [Candidatus Moduliflexus flocculans]